MTEISNVYDALVLMAEGIGTDEDGILEVERMPEYKVIRDSSGRIRNLLVFDRLYQIFEHVNSSLYVVCDAWFDFKSNITGVSRDVLLLSHPYMVHQSDWEGAAATVVLFNDLMNHLEQYEHPDPTTVDVLVGDVVPVDSQLRRLFAICREYVEGTDTTDTQLYLYDVYTEAGEYCGQMTSARADLDCELRMEFV